MNQSLENYLIVDALEEQLGRWKLCGASDDNCQVKQHLLLIEKYRDRTLAKEMRAHAASLAEQAEIIQDDEDAESFRRAANSLEKAASSMELLP